MNTLLKMLMAAVIGASIVGILVSAYQAEAADPEHAPSVVQRVIRHAVVCETQPGAIIETLTGEFAEQHRFRMVDQQGRQFDYFDNPGTHTYSIVVTLPGALACILFLGDKMSFSGPFDYIPPAPEEKGS